MGTKRPAPISTSTSVHPSRRDQVPKPDPQRKRRKPNPHPQIRGPPRSRTDQPDDRPSNNQSFKKAHPVNDLKTRIRSLTRLLARDDNSGNGTGNGNPNSGGRANASMPPKVRIEKERELQSARRALDDAQAAERRSRVIARYHRVRFFDRQKAAKRLKRARKEVVGLEEAVNKMAKDEGEGEDGEELRARAIRRVREAEVDVNYAIYYPLERAYSSLFPSRKDGDGEGDDVEDGGDGGEESVERRGDPEIRRLVRECMADGRLDDLRNGKLTGDTGDEAQQRQASSEVMSKLTPSRSAKGGKVAREDGLGADTESDDGFFE